VTDAAFTFGNDLLGETLRNAKSSPGL